MHAHIHQLHLSIDHALAVSYRRNMYDGKTAFVAHVTLVKGVPFYGYHLGYKFFLKVYMLNPLHMTRLADLLRQGTILKKVIQPYESHMQYLAQWMCDYNLYGCAYIDCSEAKFRSPVPQYLEITSTTHQWHDRTISDSSISDPDTIPRQSHCSLEVDVRVQHILNRQHISPRPIHHDFIERNNPIAPGDKLVQSMAGLWRDETKRRKARMGEIDPLSSPFPPEVLVSVSADPRYSEPGGWIHEQEYMEKIYGIIEAEKNSSRENTVGFDDFVERHTCEDYVQTSLESVEDLFPEKLARVVHTQGAFQAAMLGDDLTRMEVPEVDETRILNYEEDELHDESDEELARELHISQRLHRDQVEAHPGPVANVGWDEPVHEDGLPPSVKWSENPAVPTKSPSEDAQGPTSSTELETLGIRRIGDYCHVNDDAFEIPVEFTSDISAQRAKEQSSFEPDRKKRRLNDEESLRSSGVLQNNVKHHTESSEANDAAHGQIAGLLQVKRPPQQRHNRQNHQTTPSSQESVNSANGNRTLSFSIVKDLQDLHTIKKLRSSTQSPRKRSQKVKTESVSFTTPSERGLIAPIQRKDDSILTDRSPTLASYQVSRYSSQIYEYFDIKYPKRTLCFAQSPPQPSHILSDLRSLEVPSVLYQEAYYSNEKDIPDRAREYAGKEFKIESGTVPFLPDFDPTGTSLASLGEKPSVVVDRLGEDRRLQRRKNACRLRTWEIEKLPPTRNDVQIWLHERGEIVLGQVQLPADTGSLKRMSDLPQIDGATQKNRHGFKYSQKQKSTSVQHETHYMSVMSLEVHVNSRGHLAPNPEQDEITCVFWCLQSEDEDLEVNGINEGTHVGILALSEVGGLAHKIQQHTAVQVEEEASELDLINRMVDIVRHHDPDILTGYEVHNGSWGYLIERARLKYDYNLCDEFSRMMSQSYGRFGKDDDRWGFNHTSTIRVTGRHMINIWRAMRGELNLLQYTMENVVFQLCHRRIPHYPFQDLTTWYRSNKPRDLGKVIDYYVSRVQLDIEILEQNELVPRTSEQARLLGVDFFSVFSRGSQFKVESLMFRIAKPENFFLPSPSRKQVGQQNALECLPLVMEPQSAFYNSPLLVLDFQSLYPSVMIAYNYCYSTFLGRVVSWRGQNKMGFTDYQREPRLLELLKDQINIAPNGIIYAKPEIRKSLLAKMLAEILETRVMVKSGMKVDKDDKTLQRLLNNRQLALKLIANVTYGYTSASFSGRMPCSEIADSIVQTGRETLEKAIALIHSVERWGAEVVYGDTDSLFVYLHGRSRDEAFDIGKEIAKTITEMNPRPVKLKFEKVYHPCVLLAKKRYVGFKYESKDQEEPEFDAKGIETVRRDGTPAEQKIEEKALKILFRSADLSQVKDYFQRQCAKIMRGKVSIQDFCFAKEVKLGTYSDKGPPPPGALISTKKMLEDPRTEPQYGERVPYVVITGAPGARLIDRCVTPDLLLYNDSNELDAEYYISKNLIPPLERIFNLVGANVRQWYDEMPKYQRMRRIDTGSFAGGKKTIMEKKTLESYMKSTSCVVCHEKLEEETAICSRCINHPATSLSALRTRLNIAEKRAMHLGKVCRSCANLAWGEDVKCDSRDCPVFYTRTRHMAELRSAGVVTQPIIQALEGLEESDFAW